MKAASPPEPLAGVGATAIGVALIRAKESERADRLYDDPYAGEFADAARTAYLDPSAPSGAAERWATIERLVDPFYERRSVAVRLVDDRMHGYIAAGCEQIVLIGAGLDTRAFRLPLPAGIRVFEVDLPEMFSFKEPVLERLSAEPTCDRLIVPTDLREDWTTPLRRAGFRPEAPTGWIEEGVLDYLPRDKARELVITLTGLSAPGSRFSAARVQVAETPSHYRELTQLAFGDGDTDTDLRGLGPDVDDWLNRHSWRTEFHGWDELVAPFDRPVATGNPENGVVLATRE